MQKSARKYDLSLLSEVSQYRLDIEGKVEKSLNERLELAHIAFLRPHDCR